MTKIYDQFDKAFARVSAYVIFKGDKPIGRVCFKYPQDGAGRLWCYVQVWGAPMVRGFAGGYGYDKNSAAFTAAASKLGNDAEKGELQEVAHHIANFKAVKDNGYRWGARLSDLGYTTQHVID